MSNIDFIILNLWMFGVFYAWGNKCSFSKSSDTQFTILTIISFIFIEGFRYDRGVDHLWYGEIYKYPRLNESSIFVLFNSFLQNCGLGYTGACVIYALIFIIGSYYLIKTVNGNEQKYAHLFCICASLISFECLIRQYIAIPLIYISISLFLKRKWLLCLVFFVLGVQLHIACIFLFIVFVLFFTTRKYLVNYKLSLSILLFVNFISSVNYTSYLLPLIETYAPGIVPEGFENYILNSDRWFGEDSILEDSKQSMLAQCMQLCFDGSIIYLGYILLKEKPHDTIAIFYTLMILGVILTRAFWGMELIIRITKMFYQVWFIPLGYIFYHRIYLINKSRKNKICFLLIIVYLILYWLKYIFLTDNCKFIWS